MPFLLMTVPAVVSVAVGAVVGVPIAQGDNKRLNDAVVANVYTIQH